MNLINRPQSLALPSYHRVSNYEGIPAGFDYGFVIDLVEHFAGGTPAAINTSDLESIVRSEMKKTSRGYSFRGKEFTSFRSDAEDSGMWYFVNQLRVTLEDTQKFITALDPDRIPGVTPLDKAVSVLKIEQSMSSGKSPKEKSEDDSEGEGEQSEGDVEKEKKSGETTKQQKEANAVNKYVEVVEYLNHHPDLRDVVEQATSRPVDALPVVVVEIMHLSIKAKALGIKFAKNSQFYAKSPTGELILPMKMDDVSQLTDQTDESLVLHHSARAYWLYSITEESLMVDVPHTRVGEQELVVLVDASASMKEMDCAKRNLALGIILSGIEDAIKGVARFRFTFFREDAFLPVMEVKPRRKEQAVVALKYALNFGNISCHTQVGRAITTVLGFLQERRDVDLKPEVLVVNDGQDTVNVQEIEDIVEDKHVVIHSLQLSLRNDELEQVAKDSGGVCVVIPDKRMLELLK